MVDNRVKYGVPYKGSKNVIVQFIMKNLPKREHFYDLFAGGCAVTQAAIMSGRYKDFHVNDKDGKGMEVFFNAIEGKYLDEKRWIPREEFFRLMSTDPFVSLIWSFSNDGRTYAYSREIEEYKKAWFMVLMYDDYTECERLGIDLSPLKSISDPRERYLTSRAIFIGMIEEKPEIYEHMQNMDTYLRIERLNIIHNIVSVDMNKVHRTKLSYDEVEILPNSLIYLDPPYINTSGYADDFKKKNAFDYEKFYQWIEAQTEPVFISEYCMPEDRFVCVDSCMRNEGMCATKNESKEEKLYVPKGQLDMIRDLGKCGGLLF